MSQVVDFFGAPHINPYIHIRNDQGQVWNSPSGFFQGYVAANWTEYSIAMSGESGSKYYKVPFPTNISTAGTYGVLVYSRLSGSAASGDTDLGAGSVGWDGSGIIGLDDVDRRSYYADIKFYKDNTNNQDEYYTTWYRDAVPLTSGQFSSPTIQVIKLSDGTDLIPSTSMDHVSISIGTLRKYDGSNRTTAGEGYTVKCSATIDGQVRTWPKLIGRDG